MSTVPKQRDDGLDPEVLRLEQELLLLGRKEQEALFKRPDMLSQEQAEARAGISAEVLMQLRTEGQILGLELPDGRGGCKFPDIQFEPQIRPAIPGILQAFGRGREWEAYDVLMHTEPLLGGRKVLDELRIGHLVSVIRAAIAAAALDQGGY